MSGELILDKSSFLPHYAGPSGNLKTVGVMLLGILIKYRTQNQMFQDFKAIHIWIYRITSQQIWECMAKNFFLNKFH